MKIEIDKFVAGLFMICLTSGTINAQITKMDKFDDTDMDAYVIDNFSVSDNSKYLDKNIYCVENISNICISGRSSFPSRSTLQEYRLGIRKNGPAHVWYIGKTYHYSDRGYSEKHIFNKGKLVQSFNEQNPFNKKWYPLFQSFSEEDEKRYIEYLENEHTKRKEFVIQTTNQTTLKIEKTIKVNNKIFINRKEQATNGLPTFQYQLGVSYITGADGETNKSLGRYWLIRSAAQGNEDAEKYLKELK